MSDVQQMPGTQLEPHTAQAMETVQNTPLTATNPAQKKKGSEKSASPTGGMKYDQVENTWLQAGGSPQAAAMAAAVADASSGLNPNATRTNPDGTVSVGLWLIPKNGVPPGSADPLANARAAIHLSQNGTDWSQWCVAWSDNNCGIDGGTYLGSGSNALGALGSQLSPASYNVFGAAPSGSGAGASAATSTSTTTGSSGKSHTAIFILGLVLVAALAIYFGRKNQAQEGAPEGGPVGPVGPSTETKPVVIPAHVRGLPNPDTSGPYSPH